MEKASKPGDLSRVQHRGGRSLGFAGGEQASCVHQV